MSKFANFLILKIFKIFKIDYYGKRKRNPRNGE